MLHRGRGGEHEAEARVSHRFQMTQHLLSIGDDYFIENEYGQRAYKVDGKLLRARKTLKFEDLQGRELASIQERMLRVKDTMAIEREGRTVATVKKALIAPMRERFTVNIQGGPDLDVQGNILDHEYRIERGREPVAEISKKWFRMRDTYGVQVAPGEDDALILAVTAAIDTMAHPER